MVVVEGQSWRDGGGGGVWAVPGMMGELAGVYVCVCVYVYVYYVYVYVYVCVVGCACRLVGHAGREEGRK